MTQDAILQVWQRIKQRSSAPRKSYLEKIRRASEQQSRLSCGNIAHACASCAPDEKQIHFAGMTPNIGIITAYNDMLSAHQPFVDFPLRIKQAARANGGTAQVAGGVPAMCDGITQGQDGMELSLFSRDVIAMAAAVALSHNTYSAAIFLGVCDKIVPGMMIAAATFGHLPAIFAPAGPMPSGVSNAEKARVREQYSAGKVGREELLAVEAASYHSPGTCTFYGTANTNQMMLEMLGMQLPGTSFVNPNTPLRDALTDAAVGALLLQVKNKQCSADILNEAAFVNAMVGVLASGGSTNHTLHLPAMARACGILIDWNDFADLSKHVPLLCRLYPNGSADVNHFHAAGGMSFFVRELRQAGLLMEEVHNVVGSGFDAYEKEAVLADDNTATWRAGATTSLDDNVVRSAAAPFSATGGLALIEGNLGQAVIKVSAVASTIKCVRAPARVFNSQDDMMAAFNQGTMRQDMVCVVRYQGARANGMPELHKLTPLLATLQDDGFQVALVTDGRMSGASGKVPAAIHLSPEAAAGGMLALIQDGDPLCLDIENGTLNILLPDEEWRSRQPAAVDLSENESGCGRELFGWMRRLSGHANDSNNALFEHDAAFTASQDNA
ncbi:MAG: phosphogluconate dehydratase [Gammaproteobacteria bacterium WSBS_2016_MAG_OTU1]